MTFPIAPADPLVEPQCLSRVCLNRKAVFNSEVRPHTDDKDAFPALGNSEIYGIQDLPNDIVFEATEAPAGVEALKACPVLSSFFAFPACDFRGGKLMDNVAEVIHERTVEETLDVLNNETFRVAFAHRANKLLQHITSIGTTVVLPTLGEGLPRRAAAQ